MPYPMNQMEFEKMFSDERACYDYLIELRWQNGFKCSKCGNGNYWL